MKENRKKRLTIVVPCFNSEAYIHKCLRSLLVGGEDVEIIIVNDGSTDRTGEIANQYARDYPSIIKVVHQQNGGHGEAVNTGLQHAAGDYFKVVDSDDWVCETAYQEILEVLWKLTQLSNPVDMVISNFVYEKEGVKHKKVMRYTNLFPQNRVFYWEDIGFLRKGKYILMHSVIYRTNLLKECNLRLPKHTFYVDNIFVYHPLPYVRTMYYVNVDFYRYYIGREDQSVNEKVMIKRIDQQLKVNYLMMKEYELTDKTIITNAKMRRYMRNYLEIIMVVTSIMLIRSKAEENLEKKEKLWNELKAKDRKTYYRMKWSLLGGSMNLPGRGGRKISEFAYNVARRMVGFN